MRVVLPVVDPSKKAQLLGWSLFFVLYLYSNRIHVLAPHLLKPSPLDLAIPFLPWTVWIYLSPLVLVALEFWYLKDPETLNRLVYSMALAIVLSVIVFVAYPTELPRLAVHATGSTGLLFRLLFAVDTPCNCLPSLHVSTAFVAAFALAREKRGLFVTGLIIATLISLSTLTMKQHYCADVACGFLVAVVCHAATRLLVLERAQERWTLSLGGAAPVR